MGALDDLLARYTAPAAQPVKPVSALDQLLARGGSAMPGAGLAEAGAIPTSQIESVTGPLPGAEEPGVLADLKALLMRGLAGNQDLFARVLGAGFLPTGAPDPVPVAERQLEASKAKLIGQVGPAAATVGGLVAEEAMDPLNLIGGAAGKALAGGLAKPLVKNAAPASGVVAQSLKALPTTGPDRLAARRALVASSPTRPTAPAITVDEFLGKYRAPKDPAENLATESGLRQIMNRWHQLWVNRQAPLEKTGTMRGLVNRARAASRIARLPLTTGTYRYDPAKGTAVINGESFKDIVKGTTEPLQDELDALLMAERHIELAGRETQRIKDQAKVGARYITDQPISAPKHPQIRIDPGATEDSASIVNQLRSRPELFSLAQRLRDWQDRTVLQPLYELGVVSAKQVSDIRASNQFFAPFNRIYDDMDEALGLSAGEGAPRLRRITRGLSEDAKVSPLETMVRTSQEWGRWIERQRVKQGLVDAAANNPAIFKDVKRASPNLSRGGFNIWKNGVKETYRASPEVIEALELHTPSTLRFAIDSFSELAKSRSFPVRAAAKTSKVLFGALNVGARIQRAGATLRPVFALTNLLRDQWNATMYSKHGYVPFVDFVRGMLHRYKRDDVWEAFELSGAGMSSMVSVDRPGSQVLLRDLSTGSSMGERTRNVLDRWKREGFLYPLQILSEAAEEGTRIGNFAKAYKKGATGEDLIAAGRDVTLDFGRAGTYGAEWNGIEAFGNAGIQDVSKYTRAMRRNALATTLKATAIYTAPALAVWAKWRNDPDYQNLPEWDKSLFLHLGKRDDGTFFKIPRGIGIAPLVHGYGMAKIAEGLYQEDPSVLEDIGSQFAEDVWPLSHMNANALPTTVQPLVEAGFNYSQFRGGPVESRAMEALVPSERHYETTSPFIRRVVAPIAGAVPGLSQATAGGSPIRTEYIAEQVAAGLGKEAIGVVDAGMRWAGVADEPPNLPSDPKKIPVLGSFLSRPPIGPASEPVRQFYEVGERILQEDATAKHLASGGSPVPDKYMQARPLARVYRKYQADMTSLNKRRRIVLNSRDMDVADKSEELLQLDQIISLTAARFLDVAKEVEKSNAQ